MNVLSKEAEIVLEVVRKFRCASIEQLKRIITNENTDVEKVVAHLAARYYIDLVDDKYVTPRKKNAVDRNDINCLWAVIDSMQFEEGFDYDSFMNTQVYSPDNKVKLMFIKNHKHIVNVACISSNTIMDVVYLQNRFYEINGVKPGQEKEKNIAHYFIVKKREIADEIREMGLKIPYAVVLITYDGTEIPTIEYIK